MEWHQVASDFENNGSIREIYVLGTDLSDWQCIVDTLRGFEPRPIYRLNGMLTELPIRVEEVFGSHCVGSTILSFIVDDLAVNCHFFVVDEIEFDLDARDVGGLRQVKSLSSFMQLLGSLTNKVVILSAENDVTAAILRYSPENRQVAWVSPQDRR